MIPLLTGLFLLTSNFELGYIPGHNATLFDMSSADSRVIDVSKTMYCEMTEQLSIGKYVSIQGGMTAYSLPLLTTVSAYVFRMDYTLGATFTMNKNISLNYRHDCMHPIAPNAQMPLPRIDIASDRVFLKVNIESRL